MILSSQLQEIEIYMDKTNSVSELISKASVGWHIEHMFLTINAVYENLKASDANKYRRSLNWKRFIVFTFKKIPRGKGRSPRRVRPTKPRVKKEQILKHLEKIKHVLIKLETLPKKAHIKHPVFGVLNKKGSIKFLLIHNHHHLKIIEDIVEHNLS